jgi:hypothetical protein
MSEYMPLVYRQLTTINTAKKITDGIIVAVSAVVSVAGSGYKVGDYLLVVGGTKTIPAVFLITAVTAAGGVVTVVPATGAISDLSGTPTFRKGGGSNNQLGVYTATPGNPAATTAISKDGTATGADCTLTVTYSSAGAKPSGATAALIQAQDKAIRWRDDGVVPTASVGQVIAAGSSLWYDMGPLDRVSIIEVEATGIANITFYGHS